MPEKLSEIFLSGTAKGAVWVLLDTSLCQKRVCGKYSMQKSVLKINKCRAFSTIESQGISCIPISNTTLLGDRSVPFRFTFRQGGRLFTDKFFVDDLSSFRFLRNKVKSESYGIERVGFCVMLLL